MPKPTYINNPPSCAVCNITVLNKIFSILHNPSLDVRAFEAAVLLAGYAKIQVLSGNNRQRRLVLGCGWRFDYYSIGGPIYVDVDDIIYCGHGRP
jgi:hypothetical protein